MYTDIYFEKDDPEIVEYFEELEKAKNNESFNMDVFRQWHSHPVMVHEPGAAEGETPDYIYMVLVKDEQYEQRVTLFNAVFEDPIEDPDKEMKEKLKAKQDKMKAKKDKDKTFKQLEARFKRADGGPLMVFGPKGRTQHAPEEREIDTEE